MLDHTHGLSAIFGIAVAGWLIVTEIRLHLLGKIAEEFTAYLAEELERRGRKGKA